MNPRIPNRSAWLISLALIGLFAGATAFALSPTRSIAAIAIASNQEHQATEPPKPENSSDAKSKGEAESNDEEAKFKQSASITKLAGWLGITNNQAWWLSVLINFGIVLVAILYAAKTNLPGLFRDRTSAIQKGMDEARRASAESAVRLADIESRLAKLDDEIAAMRASAEQEAKAEEQRLLAATEDEKKKILQAAEQEIAAASNLARRELKRFAAELAVALAEKKLTVNESTDKAIVREFSRNLAGPRDGAKGGS